MSDIDLMRHWGRRDYVEEVSDSESDFGNGPLFTIQEGSEDEDSQDERVVDEEDDGEVYDEEYGNENEDIDEDEDLQDDNVKNLYGDSDTETTVHDSTANSTTTMTNMTNSSLLQVSQPSHRMGSHNYIPASATASSANGKYRTVSIFGGILDLADPTDGDGDSISSDGFSDDWSVEEEVQPQRKPRKAKPLRQAPTERIEFKSEQARDDEVHSELKSDAQQQDEPIEKSEVRAEDKEHNDRYREQEKSSEPPVKKILTSKVTESVPATTTTETTNLLQDANGFEQDAASEIDESVVTPDDIPKSIDLSLFLDKSLEERRQLQRCFLNELFFLPVS